PTQPPAWHVSLCVQALPSLHTAPFSLATATHRPVCGSHVFETWHVSGGGQTTGRPPLHTPALQVSPCVQALPSLHAVPSGLAGAAHRPVCGSHVFETWHASGGGHTTGGPPPHTPALHVSPCVQALSSLHAVPSGLGTPKHRPVCWSHMFAEWHLS